MKPCIVPMFLANAPQGILLINLISISHSHLRLIVFCKV